METTPATMNSTQTYVEARAIAVCKRRGWHSLEQWEFARLQIAREEFLNEIRPLQDIRASVLALKMPTYVVHKDGTIVMGEIKFTDTEQEVLNSIDEYIEIIRKRYGGKD